MNRVLFLVVAALTLALSSASAQYISTVRNSLEHAATSGGVVTITEDEGVKSAVARVEANTATPSKAQGYRLVVYYDNQQYADERAARVLREFRAKFKDVTSYIASESPSFRVVVGDCFNYEDAAIVRNRIIDDYPDAAICDAAIPYRVLCHIKGTNSLKIERSGQVVGGAEIEVATPELTPADAVAPAETPIEVEEVAEVTNTESVE